MSAIFDYIIAYEDRDSLHTSRWKITGVDTRDPGNTERGWLWMSTVDVSNAVTVSLFKDAAGSSKVMEGTGDISGIADAAVKVTLAEASLSGLSGEMYLEDYDDDTTLVPVLVTLCIDADLSEHWYDIDTLPSDIYSATNGMDIHCAAATKWALLQASQKFSDELGGHGGPEDRRLSSATRLVPDFRRIVVPDQLKEIATLRAIGLALGSAHQRHEDTMYSTLSDKYAEMLKDALDSMNLTFNVTPDTNDDADMSANTATIHPTRL